MVRAVVNYNVEGFLTHFNSAGFDLLILRGYKGLPENYGRDLDLAIPLYQYRSFVKELLSFTSAEGLRLFRYVYRPHVSSFKFYRVRGTTLERFILDVSCRGGTWYGFSYLSNDELFEHSHKVGSYRIPCILHEIALKIFTNMLIAGKPPRKYYEEISSYLPQIKSEFLNFVAHRFPGVDHEGLYLALMNRDDATLLNFVPRLRAALMRRAFRDKPEESLISCVKTIFAEIYWYIQRNGLRVYVLKQDENIDWDRWIEELSEKCGHVWKKVMIWKPRSTLWGRIVDRLLQGFELLRDRLIVVRVERSIHNSLALCNSSNFLKEDKVIYVAESVYSLYRLLEDRNKKREKNALYRKILWGMLSYNDILVCAKTKKGKEA